MTAGTCMACESWHTCSSMQTRFCGKGSSMSIAYPTIRTAGAFVAMLLGLAAQAGAAVPAVVGEATLVIGQAHVLTADGQKAPVERGASIRVGDLIQTEAGGHVHVKFVDGGRVSVRPSSRLQIESYSHSVQQPQLSAIKFRLDEGAVRSITGSWGEAARQRFRLNTPLAAIGVKGTDFIVHTALEATSATVFTGAITVAPLSGACADALGSCHTGGEKLLSEDMKGQMVELARLQASPRLVPAVDSAMASLQQRPAGASSASAKPQAGESSALASAAEKPLLNETRAASAVTALGPEASTVPALSWARYPWAQQLAGDDFSRQFEVAMLQGEERLGGNGAYALMRQMGDSAMPSYAHGAGLAKFQLAHGAAHVVRGEGNVFEPVHIGNAALSVDFNKASFSTELQLSGPWLGTDTVRAAGQVSSAGILQATTGNVSLQGGVSGNGREAGFAFQKGVPAGVLQGVTLWGR